MRVGVPAPGDVLCQRPPGDRRTGGDLLAGPQARFHVPFANAHLAFDDRDARAILAGIHEKHGADDGDGHVLRPHVQVPVTLLGRGDDDVAGLQVDPNPVRGTTNGQSRNAHASRRAIHP